MNKLTVSSCELCDSAGGEALWQDELCRVVLVKHGDYPGFCRVILNRHMKEMTDLDMATRQRLMQVVFAVEQALRKLMQPAKTNLASLGNMTAHLHGHVIPRFADDKHFPGSVWSEVRRPGVPRSPDRDALQSILRNELKAVAQ